MIQSCVPPSASLFPTQHCFYYPPSLLRVHLNPCSLHLHNPLCVYPPHVTCPPSQTGYSSYLHRCHKYCIQIPMDLRVSLAHMSKRTCWIPGRWSYNLSSRQGQSRRMKGSAINDHMGTRSLNRDSQANRDACFTLVKRSEYV